MHRPLKPQVGFVLILSCFLFASPPILRAQSPEAAAPALSPPPDSYTDGVTVTLSSLTPEGTVHCTSDDSIPTSASPVCTSLNLTVTTALKAITVAPGYADSPQAGGLYVIEKSGTPTTPPTITFDFPTDNLTVYSRVPVLIRVLPSNNIAAVFLSVDGELQNKTNQTGLGYHSYVWDTTPLPAGEHTLKADVLDGFGYTYSQTLVTSVSKDVRVDPIVAACQPTSGAPAYDIFGINDPLLTDDEGRINELRRLNVRWVRHDFNWASIERTHGSAYDWSYADQLVGWAHYAGIQVLVTLNGTPEWLSALDRPARYDAYRQFAQAAAARYAPEGIFAQTMGWRDGYGVSHWELWNEPNQDGRGWAWPPNPEVYATMLGFGQAGLRAADRNAIVVMGGLSGSGMGASGFLDYLYTLGAKDCFDVLNYHPFPWSDDFQSAVDTVQQVVAPYGDQDKPIWFTEYGAISRSSLESDPLAQLCSEECREGYLMVLAAGQQASEN